MHQKCIKNALNRLHDASKRLPRRLQDGPRRILPPFWAPTWGQVGAMLATFPAQDASMTPPRRSKMPSKILWIAQDGPRGLQTCPGALQTSIGASGLAPNGFFRIFKERHVGSHFGANLASFSLPKSTKILPKTNSRRFQFFDRFLDGFFIHFGSNLGLNLELCWSLFRTEWGDRN